MKKLSLGIMLITFSCQFYHNPFQENSFNPKVDHRTDNSVIPIIKLSPSVTSLNFGNIIQNCNYSKSITITNTGNVDVTWDVSHSLNWISVNPSNGKTKVSKSSNVTIIAKPDSVGNCNGSINLLYGRTNIEINLSANSIDDSIEGKNCKTLYHNNHEQKLVFTLPEAHRSKPTTLMIWYYTDSNDNNYTIDVNAKNNHQFPASLNKMATELEPVPAYPKDSFYLKFASYHETPYELHIWKISYDIEGNYYEILSDSDKCTLE